MKAVILAGGFGTRLRPLTCTQPKPLAKLLGKPVISYLLELLHASGVTEAVLTTAYLPACMEAYLADNTPAGMQVRTVTEEEPLGTAGCVRAAAAGWTESFFVLSGDCLCDFDLKKAFAFHKAAQAQATILTTRVRDPREYGLVQTAADGRVTGFCEKPGWNAVAVDAANTGIYVLEPSVLADIPKDCAYDFSKQLFPQLLEQGRPLYAFNAQGYWCDIGDLSAYRACQTDLLRGKVRVQLPAVAGGVYTAEALPDGEYQIIPPVYIGKNTAFERGTVVGPNAVIGDGCYLGKHVKIRDSVLLENVAVYDHAVVNGAVLCENTVLKSGTEVYEDSAVGAQCVVGNHTRIGPRVKIWPQKTIENGMRVSGNIKYGIARHELFSDSGICGLPGVDFDPIHVAAIGRSLASSIAGGKIGIATDGTPQSRAVYHILAGAMAAQGGSVWNFGTCFLPQLYFFTAFCTLPVGVYVCERNNRLQLRLCSTGGLPLSRALERELELRYQNSDFVRTSPAACKEISDMANMQAMYLRELTREAGMPLKNQSVSIRCGNENIHMLMEDCLYRLEAKSGDEITFKFNNDGTSVSAFHRDCGWIPFDKLLAICCKAEFEAGHDVALQTDAPYAISRLAFERGRRVARYTCLPADQNDGDVKALALEQLYVRDALFLSIRLLGILQKKGKTLSALFQELPAFFIRRKNVIIDFPPTQLLAMLHLENAETQNEGVTVQMPHGRVLLVPRRNGRQLSIIAEADSFEASRELCGDIQARLSGH